MNVVTNVLVKYNTFAYCLNVSGYLFALLHNTEDGGLCFLKTSVSLYRTAQHYSLKDNTLHSHHWKPELQQDPTIWSLFTIWFIIF
jgi:hypothetical protein